MKKIMRICLLFLIYCGIGNAAETDHLSCTTEYCDDFMATNPCSELPKACNGTSSLAKFLPSPTVCNCCDYCLVYIGENEICAKGTSGAPTTSSICGPGLTCVKEEDASDAYCKSLNTTCIQQQQEYEERKSSGKLRMTELRPQCDEKGNFAPAHCIQGSICYCVSNTGERIFGEQVYTNSAMLTDMTCECSLAAWTSGQLLDFETQPAHCLANGSYDPLQCVGGKCICVDIEDATPVSGGKTVNIELVSNATLPCFDSSLHEEGEFDHECEMSRVQDLNTKRSFQLQGYNVIGLETPQCTPDGNYHRVRVVNDDKICVDPDGNSLGFKVNRFGSDALDMDCNCARTRWLLTQAGLKELPSCKVNGNFENIQCYRGVCFCVDLNGNQISDETDENNKNYLVC